MMLKLSRSVQCMLLLYTSTHDRVFQSQATHTHTHTHSYRTGQDCQVLNSMSVKIQCVTLTFAERFRLVFSLSGFANLSTKNTTKREFGLSENTQRFRSVKIKVNSTQRFLNHQCFTSTAQLNALRRLVVNWFRSD